MGTVTSLVHLSLSKSAVHLCQEQVGGVRGHLAQGCHHAGLENAVWHNKPYKFTFRFSLQISLTSIPLKTFFYVLKTTHHSRLNNDFKRRNRNRHRRLFSDYNMFSRVTEESTSAALISWNSLNNGKLWTYLEINYRPVKARLIFTADHVT